MGKRLHGTGGWVTGAVLLVVLLGLTLTGGRLRAAEGVVSRTTLAVERITCGACLRVIDAELRKVPGILGMTADLATNRVTVDHDPALTAAEVAAKVTGAGYPARVEATTALPRSSARLFQREPGFGSGPGCCNPGGSNPVADSWRELRRRFLGRRCGPGGGACN